MSTDDQPWWASGDDPEAAGTDDAFDAHQRARNQNKDADWQEELADQIADAEAAGGRRREPGGPEAPHWLGDAVQLVGRMAVDATQRLQAVGQSGDGLRDPVHDHPAGHARRDGADGRRGGGDGAGPPHPPGEVCNACPFCLGLRAVRQVRPEVIGHLSDAAHHLSLALRAIADAAADGPDDVEHIPLDD